MRHDTAVCAHGVAVHDIRATRADLINISDSARDTVPALPQPQRQTTRTPHPPPVVAYLHFAAGRGVLPVTRIAHVSEPVTPPPAILNPRSGRASLRAPAANLIARGLHHGAVPHIGDDD